MKVKELLESEDVETKLKTGNYRIVLAIGGAKYSLERKRPSTGEWLIGVKLDAKIAKRLIKTMRKETGTHYEYWYYES